MALNKFSDDLTDHDLGDWIELSAFKSQDLTTNLSELQREFGILQEVDADSTDYLAEELLDRISGVIADRIIRIEEANYPFAFNQDGSELSVKESLTESQVIYLFCLVLSHTRAGDILNGSYIPVITEAVRRCFQGCSTVAAAGLVQGNAIWFGFPRPDHTNFLSKLHKVYEVLNDGVPVSTPRPGVSPSPKDEEIDIIAWRKRADANIPDEYVLAQVASGNNWSEKSVKGAIDSFHQNWFSPVPSCNSSAGMFMPMLFTLQTGATLEEQLQIYTRRFGKFLFRYSIPLYYGRGINLANQDKSLTIEGMECFPEINQWVDSQRNLISAA